MLIRGKNNHSSAAPHPPGWKLVICPTQSDVLSFRGSGKGEWLSPKLLSVTWSAAGAPGDRRERLFWPLDRPDERCLSVYTEGFTSYKGMVMRNGWVDSLRVLLTGLFTSHRLLEKFSLKLQSPKKPCFFAAGVEKSSSVKLTIQLFPRITFGTHEV